MRTTEDAVRMLGGLSEEDRRWILEKLPVAARMRLADAADDPQVDEITSREPVLGSVPMEDFEWDRNVAELSAANPSSLAQTLHGEPAWIVDAVLHAANWPWNHVVRKSLPVGMRAELAAIDRSGVRLAKPATQVLLRELAQRSRDWPPAPARATGLKAVLSRLREKVAR
jgi:hypothetical protein